MTMAEHAARSRPFPLAPLVGAFVLIVATLLAVAAARTLGIGGSAAPPAPALVEIDLRFEDQPDGTIAVYDAASNRRIDVIAGGTNGFLRATLRGLARERKRQGGEAAEPFRLAERADGRLTLEDTATGKRINLEAFGSTNAAAFARLLHTPEAAGKKTP